MKILMITNAVMPDQLGGLQRYVRELAGAVHAQGAEVVVLTKAVEGGPQQSEVAPDGVRLERYSVPRKGLTYAAGYPVAAVRAVSSALRRHPDAVVHVHYPLQGFRMIFGQRRYAVTYHAPAHKELLQERQQRYPLPRAVQTPAVAAFRSLEAKMLRGASDIVVLSDFMRGQTLETAGLGVESRITNVPGGLATTWFTPGSDVVDPNLLFTARRLVPRTGVHALVAAMPRIVSAFPSIRLRVAGTGPREDELRAMIRDLRLEHHVELLGRISDEELRDSYRTSGLSVMPTQELEGFGLTTAEAMSCGAAVVGTPAGATPELLNRLSPRFVASDITPDALADAIIGVLRDPDLLQSARKRARAAVHPGLGWEEVAKAHIPIYERIARGRG